MAFQYIEAPNYEEIVNPNSIFLAGGITGCRDFQKEMVNALQQFENLTVCNPRREKFEMFKNESGFNDSIEQIKWEYKYLRLVKVLTFWFSHETVQPITLFELGAALERWNGGWDEKSHAQHIIIGRDENYSRKFDVDIQTKLSGYPYPIFTTFDIFLYNVVIHQKNIEFLSRKKI